MVESRRLGEFNSRLRTLFESILTFYTLSSISAISPFASARQHSGSIARLVETPYSGYALRGRYLTHIRRRGSGRSCCPAVTVSSHGIVAVTMHKNRWKGRSFKVCCCCCAAAGCTAVHRINWRWGQSLRSLCPIVSSTAG